MFLFFALFSINPFHPVFRNSIYGDQAVRFSENGRLIYPGQQVSGRDRPTNMLLWRGGADPSGSDPVPANNPNFRYRPWSRTVAEPSVANSPTAPIITRRVERIATPAGYGSNFVNELPYATGRPFGLPISGGRPLTTPAASKPITTTMAPETIVIEEMRVYDEKPCGWWLFLIVGFLVIGVGIANIVLCFDYHMFCFLWTGIAVSIAYQHNIVYRLASTDGVSPKTWLFISYSTLSFIATSFTANSCHST